MDRIEVAQMVKLFQILKLTQAECRTYGDWLRLNASSLEDFFAMLHKHAQSAQEILQMYGDRTSEIELGLFKKDYNERFMLVLRSTWIFSLSVVEYSMKRIIGNSISGPLVDWYSKLDDHSHVKGAKKGFYLRSIIEKSHDLEMIDQTERDSWVGLQDIRNAIIHNNAYFEEDKTYTIGAKTINAKAAQKIRYPHLHRAHFILVIPRMSINWLKQHLRSGSV
jgi:hypothetical protein